MPQKAVPVRNVWSGNMAIRRSVFDSIGVSGATSERWAAVPARKTQICASARPPRQPGGTWVYEPAGIVGQRAPLTRATLLFFLRRCFNEGSGKAALAALNGTDVSTSAERASTRQVLPQGFARGLRNAAHGHGSEALRKRSPSPRDSGRHGRALHHWPGSDGGPGQGFPPPRTGCRPAARAR